MRHDLPEIHPELMAATREPTASELCILLDSFQRDGWREPILTAEIEGQTYVVDGHSRIMLLRQHENLPAPSFRHLGKLTLDAAKYLVCELTLTRKHFSVEQRAVVMAIRVQRKLAQPLPPSKNAAIKEVAAEAGLTPATVKADVLRVEKAERASSPAAAAPKKPKPPPRSEFESDIHESLDVVRGATNEIGDICVKLGLQVAAIRRAAKSAGMTADDTDLSQIEATLTSLSLTRPHSICSRLPERALCPSNCTVCNGRGWINRRRWGILAEADRKAIVAREGVFE